MAIDNNEFWDENYYNHPPLTDEMIRVAEKKLKVTLPISYINLLRLQNGGYTKGYNFPTTQKTSWSETHVSLNTLFGIVTDKTVKTAQNILSTDYMTKEWGLPKKQVILSGEGEWWITLDYRKGANPTVN